MRFSESLLTVFAALPQKTINGIINDKWKGANFSQRVWANTSQTAKNAYDIVTRGIMTGANVRTMTQQLSETMQAGMYASMRLIRTETNRVHNAAEREAYKEEEIENYRFLATLDGRTCERCGRLDGKTFLVEDTKEGVNFPPLHPNDRCTTVQAMDGETLENLKRRARDPETGKIATVPGDMTWKEWKRNVDNGSENGIIKSAGKDILPVSKPKARHDNAKAGSNLLSKEQKDSLLAFEQRHRDEFLESAYCVNPQTGESFEKTTNDPTSVTFTPEEQAKMKGCILTHNHPNNSEFSPNDIFMLYRLGLSEIRASVDGGAFVIRPTSKTIWHDDLKSLSRSLTACTNDEISRWCFALAQEKQLSFIEYDSLAAQAGVEEFAKRYRYSYFFEEID